MKLNYINPFKLKNTLESKDPIFSLPTDLTERQKNLPKEQIKPKIKPNRQGIIDNKF